MTAKTSLSISIATRGSKLALWQAEYVRAELQRREPELAVELLVLKTQGDRVLDRALSEIGGKGLFTKEIEDALLDGRAQIAVHSMKDLPAHGPPGLLVAAVPERADARDALLLSPGLSGLLSTPTTPGEDAACALVRRLPAAARVGTSSLRRVCQLRRLRPDLTIVPLRGNVDTRLRKLLEGELDAAVLAAAGLARLGLAAHIAARFSPTEMLPACGQGALAIQCRSDDPSSRARLEALADWATTVTTAAERAFSLRLGGSCQTPLGAHGELAALDVPASGSQATAEAPRRLRLTGMVGSLDGARLLRGDRECLLHPPALAGSAELGTELAEQLLAQGAAELLR